MAVYLQFDSLARSDPFIKVGVPGDPPSSVWIPNDNYTDPPNQTNRNLIQTPSNYRVFYRDMQNANNLRTIGFLAHCKERPENLTFSVESCVVTVPASALITLGDGLYTSILNEPYLYIRLMPITNSEGNLIYGNNHPPVEGATFIVWRDSTQVGTVDPPLPPPPPPPLVRPNPQLPVTDLTIARWVTYKTCMITTMRLDLQAEEWQVRIYDRYGNDVILAEAAAGIDGDLPPPLPDRNLQTMVLVGIRPNYPTF